MFLLCSEQQELSLFFKKISLFFEFEGGKGIRAVRGKHFLPLDGPKTSLTRSMGKGSRVLRNHLSNLMRPRHINCRDFVSQQRVSVKNKLDPSTPVDMIV